MTPCGNLFFIVGPLRTGSSLTTRCIDDHPSAICLCESEINRALFLDYFVELHARRMLEHGISNELTLTLLDRRKQDHIASLTGWYHDIQAHVTGTLEKADISAFGDKSPDYYRSPDLVSYLVSQHPLIYTVRDPRAIYQSIHSQTDASPRMRAIRWSCLRDNYRTWKPHLESRNVLIVRFEDLLTSPETVMSAVYAHIGLPYSARFMDSFARVLPKRFLWTRVVDWENGANARFDSQRIDGWREQMDWMRVPELTADPLITEFMQRFNYSE